MQKMKGRPTDIQEMPGHYIRRLQQIAVAVFLQETEILGITPIQYAALHSLKAAPGLDQRSLAGMIGLDTSTLAGVIDRLEARGLVLRSNSSADRRVRLLSLTKEGEAMLNTLEPLVQRAQEQILKPLSKAERKEFMRLAKILVTANNDLSRAPSQDRE